MEDVDLSINKMFNILLNNNGNVLDWSKPLPVMVLYQTHYNNKNGYETIIRSEEGHIPDNLNHICETLNLDELNNFRQENNIESINCIISIDDKYIKKIYSLDSVTYDIINSIEKHGSSKYAFNIINNLTPHNLALSMLTIRFLVDLGLDINDIDGRITIGENLVLELMRKGFLDGKNNTLYTYAVNILFHIGVKPTYVMLSQAVEYLNLDMVKSLLNLGLDINHEYGYKKENLLIMLGNMVRTPKGDTIFRYLIENGIDVNHRGYRGMTILLNRDLSKDQIEFLVDHGADLNVSHVDGIFPIDIHSDDYDKLKFIVDNGGELKNNFLTKNIDHVNLEIVNYFLSLGLDINYQDENGRTALMLVADSKSNNKDHVKILELLLSYGADPNIQDNEGNTALFWTLNDFIFSTGPFDEKSTKIKLLLENGADINHINNKGQTILDVAHEKKYNEVEEFLRSLAAE